MYKYPKAYIILNFEIANIFPRKMRNRTKMFSQTTSIQHCAGGPGSCNRKEKRNKRHKQWKGDDTMIVNIKKPKGTYKETTN